MAKKRYVLVTTAHRGVFAGYLVGTPAKTKVTLDAARNVTYWDTATRSFMGLAAQGPTPGCRVSKPAGDASVLYDITGVFACTDEARLAFEAAPWA